METALVATLARQGIRDSQVLAAIMRVPRDAFVPETLRDAAHDDTALPIGYGQTISQPSVVAVTTEALQVRPGQRILEIGTGSGYQAAVLAELGAQVFSVERIPELAEQAALRLARLRLRVRLKVGDGTLGWPDEAPFDRIVVTAAADRVPAPLLAQLAPGGRLVMPLGGPEVQELTLVFRDPEGTWQRRPFLDVRFVPLIGPAH